MRFRRLSIRRRHGTNERRPERSVLATVAIGAALVGAACGAAGGPAAATLPPTFPAEAFAVLPSDSGTLQVAVRTWPQPPVKGVDAVQYVVTDADGNGVDGLDLTVVPWMPAHGHGTSVGTVVAPQGGGVYQITEVYLYMDGHWELRSTFSGGAAPDSIAPAFDVP